MHQGKSGLRIEGMPLCDHLVQNAAQGPRVGLVAVWLAVVELGGHIVWGANYLRTVQRQY